MVRVIIIIEPFCVTTPFTGLLQLTCHLSFVVVGRVQSLSLSLSLSLTN
ncbi:hypothetical protein OAV88_02690 [bacterium]|nr:hypothetical protein [bacterium]